MMRPRIYKWFLILSLMLTGTCISYSQAYAGFNLASCASPTGLPPEAISQSVVYCVKTTIEGAVTNALQGMSDYLRGTVMAVLLLATTMHGAKIVSGERDMTAKSIGFFIRMGFVAYFSYNLGGFAQRVFDIMDEVLAIALGGYVPWPIMDAFLQTVFGFAPGIALSQGLLWLATGLTSGTAGFGMSSALIVGFIEFILFFVEIIYMYLMAIAVVAFMMIVSPLFVPTIMFQPTERYFKKWLDTIIGAMLIPVFLFGFLFVSLGVLAPLLTSVFQIILPGFILTFPPDPAHPPDFSAFWRMHNPTFSWNLPNDPNAQSKIQNAIGGIDATVPPTLNIIAPFNRGGLQASAFNFPAINFGVRDKATNQKLMFAFISLCLYLATIKELVKRMPEIAQEIAGSASSINFQTPNFKAKIAEIKENMVSGAGALAGGLAGGVATSGVRDAKVREAGVLGGGALGAMLARRNLL